MNLWVWILVLTPSCLWRYRTASIYFKNTSTVNVAKIEGSPAYKAFMRSNPKPDTLLCSILCICRSRNGDVAAAAALLSTLKSAVTSYFGTTFCFADITLALDKPAPAELAAVFHPHSVSPHVSGPDPTISRGSSRTSLRRVPAEAGRRTLPATMPVMPDGQLELLRERLRACENIILISGAGISTNAGSTSQFPVKPPSGSH